ncbi:MAG: phosphate ABC transporter substrate-binding protein PstS [Candidatus Margulisiibacteriota bacterium]
MKRLRLQLVLSLLVAVLMSFPAQAAQLLGAGATFPYPFYSKLFSEYAKQKKVQVNYQSIGSGGGIRQILNKTVDFGATDGFMSDAELKKAPGELLHIPTCMGAVAVVFNLPGVKTLKLTPEIVSGLFMGTIKKWNDPKIKAVNPGVAIPALPVVVIHRSDGSGTTFVFTDYLCKVSPAWLKKVGQGTSVKWPLGLGAKGNEGVAGMLKLTPGSVGYSELAYVLQNKLTYAAIRNKSGAYVAPTLDAISASATIPIPSHTRVSITDTAAKTGYPISSFTWLIVYKEQNYNNRKLQTAETLSGLLKWIIRDGQRYAKPLDYAPLPKNVQKQAETLASSLTYFGRPVR